MKIITEFNKVGASAFFETQNFAISPHIQTLRSVLVSGNYIAPEASINLPTDSHILEAVEKVVKNTKTTNLKYIFLIGIGGSNLGTKAVYEAMFMPRDVLSSIYPRIIFIDTNNVTLLQSYLILLNSLNDPSEYLIVSVSKSGGTTETIANTEILLTQVKEKWGNRPDRVIIISDKNSPFLQAGKKIGAHCLSIPPIVGGRYSVLGVVGLVPLALVGLDIVKFRQGAEEMANTCVHPEIIQNPAAIAAVTEVQAYRAGKNIHDLFLFNSELESLGKWWRQLLGESIGKAVIDGVNQETVGITPTVSIGSTDLHSVGQLYLGGPNDKLTTFLSVKNQPVDIVISSSRFFPKLIPMINNKSVNVIMDAIMAGTKSAYTEKGRQYLDIELSEISPFELGAFMQFKMIEVMYIGKLLKVNPFNQPNVESYKQKTKEILENG